MNPATATFMTLNHVAGHRALAIPGYKHKSRTVRAQCTVPCKVWYNVAWLQMKTGRAGRGSTANLRHDLLIRDRMITFLKKNIHFVIIYFVY